MSIPCEQLDSDEWLRVSMSAHAAGIDYDTWDEWNKTDPARYDAYQNETRWSSFGHYDPEASLTAGTLVATAKQHGYVPPTSAPDKTFSFDDEISLVDKRYIDTEPLPASVYDGEWHPARELIQYLRAVFEEDEYVCYVCESYQKPNETKYLPRSGAYDRTAGELIEELEALKNDDIAAVLGDWDPKAGAWICHNPVDGTGRKNSNITSFRYVLVESDTDDLETQYALIKALNLPCAAVVTSGNKSLHAIVHVDAKDMREYRERVEYIFSECKEAGLHVDSATRNPSRLSRLPGATRNGKRQALVATNVGPKSYGDWIDWIAEERDDLPPIESFYDVYSAGLPELAPPLIDGILRLGHKGIYAGGSKANKSMTLIALALAVANGSSWMGHKCRQGRVLYINLEIDGRSAYHRIDDVFKATPGLTVDNFKNLDVWTLRGRAGSLEELAPRIVHRCKKAGLSPDDGGYSLIILDPTYKVQDGDENAAGDIARFCNRLDYIASELKASLMYAHHHSKGAQGSKASIDRMSGSGVFARDADAIIDATPLVLSTYEREACRDDLLKKILEKYANKHVDIDEVNIVRRTLGQTLPNNKKAQLTDEIEDMMRRDRVGRIPDDDIVGADTIHASRVTFTLREFATPKPVNVWFDYPIHVVDTRGILDSCPYDGPANIANDGTRRTKQEQRDDNQSQLDSAYDALKSEYEDGVLVEDIAGFLNTSTRTIYRRLKDSDQFEVTNKRVFLKN